MDKKISINPFRRVDGNQQQGKTKKESEWGKVKFNPVNRAAAVEQATPWSHFKNDLIKQQDESKMTNNPNSQEILRKREETYRRNLITSKRNQPTQWEDFSEEINNAESSSKATKNNKKKGIFHGIPSIIENINSIKKEDFDARLLTKHQNNYLKQIITKNVGILKGSTFEQAVGDMKLHGVIKKPMKVDVDTKQMCKKKKTKK